MKGRRRDPQSRQAATCSGDDRLSKLPDDVLLNILERLGTLDAIRTCILSKQMLKLPTMLSQIFIDFYSAMRGDDQSFTTTRDLARINGAVADVTDMILISSRSPLFPVRKLKLRFVLRRYDCISIGKSVVRAMAARKLDGAVEFEVLTECGFEHCADADVLQFGEQFNTFLGDCPDAFACLTRLDLHNLRFGESDIPKVLSACERLESLRLHNCDAGIGSVLRVEHPRLVELEIFCGEFETVELICLPKLQRMNYTDWVYDEDPLYFVDVPQFAKLSLTKNCYWGQTLKLSQVLANAPTITNLHLDFQSEKIWVRPESPRLLAPVLDKLHHLNMDFLPEGCDIAWTMFFLEAAPSLGELCLTVWDHWCGTEKLSIRRKKADVKWQLPAPDFKHKSLTKLTIYGFQSDGNFTGFVRRVMKAAANVEEISLYDRKVCKFCTKEFEDYETEVFPSSQEKDSLREKITGGLIMASPDVIRFRS
ncbi:uncharacterized protein LOC124695675 [Lolium rigidum]|uniref:uncharacterized protein LOC124695675 n=1 Tax=Lolium rigidum TaxID=89674 RepID=UPI001F5D2F1E|nr:uncharacterized protein LOC124695675 [Lolium rigidum]